MEDATTTDETASPQELGTCPFCQTSILADESPTSCGDCHTRYHEDCWKENEGCAMYGCSASAETIKWTDNQVPLAYWGKESKECPNCSKEIIASALRCKHCGTVFKSSRPSNAQEFSIDQTFDERKKSLQSKAMWVFIANAIPLLGIAGLLVGGIWTLKNRKLLAKLPGISRTLCYLGLAVGVGQIVLFSALGYIYTLSNSGN